MNDPRDEQQFAELYRQLRSAARSARSKNPQRTINTTALIHEAWLKIDGGSTEFRNREHFVRTAALAMRQVLVDYARYRGATRRDRKAEMPLIDSQIKDLSLDASDDLLALDQALAQLEAIDARAATLVVLRFFAGLSSDEAAELLEVSPRTAARDWIRARAFLKSKLGQ